MSNATKKLAKHFQPVNKYRAVLGEQMRKATAELRENTPSKITASLPADIKSADLSIMAERLNTYPKQFAEMEKNELYHAWDDANKIEKSSAWLKGHVALTINRKFGEASIKDFAETKGVSYVTVYRYIKLAEVFPKVDKILEPTFFFKAIELSRGDNDQAVKLIEEAREKKKENPKYSVSQFMAEASSKTQKKDSGKTISTESALNKALELAKILKGAKDLMTHEKEIEQLKKAWGWLFQE